MLNDLGLPNKIYTDPHYSNELDTPDHPREYAGLVYYIQGGSGISTLKEWDDGSGATRLKFSHVKLDAAGTSGWEYASLPPSVREVKRWLKMNALSQVIPKKCMSGPSQVSKIRCSLELLCSVYFRFRARHNMTCMG